MRKKTDHADEFVLVNIGEAEGIQSSEGVAKPLVFGRNISSICLEIPPHFEVPAHSHSQETIIFCVEGSFTRTAAGITKSIGPGDVYLVPSGCAGGIKTGEKAVKVIACSSPSTATSKEAFWERIVNSQNKKRLHSHEQQNEDS